MPRYDADGLRRNLEEQEKKTDEINGVDWTTLKQNKNFVFFPVSVEYGCRSVHSCFVVGKLIALLLLMFMRLFLFETQKLFRIFTNHNFLRS